MTGLQRLAAVLSGTPADGRMVAPTLSLYGARYSEAEPQTYYRDSASYARGQRGVAERLDPDVLFGPFALALEAEACGAELAWHGDGPPIIRKPVRRHAACAPEAGGASGPGRGNLPESVARLVDEFGGEKPVAAIAVSPTDLYALVYGLDEWLEILLFHEKEAGECLASAEEHFATLAAAYARAGASFIALPVEFANPRILTEKLIMDLTLPCLARTFAASPLPIVFHHGGPPLAERIGLFKDLPKVAAFVLDEKDDSGYARRTLGPLPVLMQGPSGPLMASRGTAGTIAAARRILESAADDPRFILATSGADIPLSADEETVLAFIRTGREWR
ncbi:MAG TPA: uroporphyrinogen decarboxylase [Treponema sp.]|nr:MAG: hypothetical protein A2Y36_11540 [Treponema sp. GWA1_62_8]OHE64397.1 MAG: hypothetical protein A2001_00020 [Treponema sp. GWC1_61_84]HCM29168.1 uroporphyrinogen decarboxylase [Treponema sp.]